MVIVGLVFFTMFALFVTNSKVGQQVFARATTSTGSLTSLTDWEEREYIEDPNEVKVELGMESALETLCGKAFVAGHVEMMGSTCNVLD
ncbi:hypothetical protein JHK85_010009 [Glycine max]|nr:hypothetical protein JHK85_010009 [Glycine max]